MSGPAAQRWTDREKVDEYLGRVPRLAARRAGEAMVVDALPDAPQRILDLGCGDGRLTDLVLRARPEITDAVAIDRSPPMLDLARDRFVADRRVSVAAWDLDDNVSPFGEFDVIVSGFAIHHLDDARKQTLFTEVSAMLRPRGAFINLEVVASATPDLHQTFLTAIGRTADDPEDRLAAVDDQLAWMRAAGLVDVDCLWRWRGFAVLAGSATAAPTF
jgi:SAM-dependent methyltransferase